MSKSNFPAATRSIERYMTDIVRIHRPVDIDDVTVNNSTLQLQPPDPEILYEGKALVSAMGDPGDQAVGMGTRVITYYTVALPVMDVDFQPDDILTVLDAMSDSQLQDVTLRVEGQIPSTINVYKRLRARLDIEAS